MTTLHLLQAVAEATAGLDALLAWFSTAWLALGEIFSVAGLLVALNFLATAIRRTYAAGRFVGRIWFLYLVPALLWAADGISWLIAEQNRLIDWNQVASDLAHYVKCIAALLITAVEQAVPMIEAVAAATTDSVAVAEAVTAINTAVVRTIGLTLEAVALDSWSWLLQGLEALNAPVPLAADQLQSMTVKELRALAAEKGLAFNTKTRKAALVALLVA